MCRLYTAQQMSRKDCRIVSLFPTEVDGGLHIGVANQNTSAETICMFYMQDGLWQLKFVTLSRLERGCTSSTGWDYLMTTWRQQIRVR